MSSKYNRVSAQTTFLSDTAILIQAWKKSQQYISQHNWYSDSLELDISSITIEQLLAKWSNLIQKKLKTYKPDPMRLVPAPKSGQWSISNGWAPMNGDKSIALRPLAHLSIRDQTFALAIVICLADLVETIQGDPEFHVDLNTHNKIVNYGHRLVCQWEHGEHSSARFKWGNAKLYRQYFKDYSQFVRRPDIIRDICFPGDTNNWAIVKTDIAQFYDRIQRGALIEKIGRLIKTHADNSHVDEDFFSAIEAIFSWKWDRQDWRTIKHEYQLSDNEGIPQGLAAAGFLSNIYLLDFDAKLISSFGEQSKSGGWKILDYCRYVDDMRFVVELNDQVNLKTFPDDFSCHLNNILKDTSPGLSLNSDKTRVKFGDGHKPKLDVANAMRSVDTHVSGVMDVATAEQALNLLDGLFATSARRVPEVHPGGTGQDAELLRLLSTESDVRNDTVERFVAHRWRRVYRSLRIMTDEESDYDSSLGVGISALDQRAESIAVGLLRRWIDDPSNVRLLRVSMDMFPVPSHLEIILKLLKSKLGGTANKHSRLVCTYVAAELLRAGSVETGFVKDQGELPRAANIESYRVSLTDFALYCLDEIEKTPWYLEQQALLFLAVTKHSINYKPKHQVNYSYAALSEIVTKNQATYTFSDSHFISLMLVANQITGDIGHTAKHIAATLPLQPTKGLTALLLSPLAENEELLSSVWNALDANKQDRWKHLFTSLGHDVPSTLNAEWVPRVNQSGWTGLHSIIRSSHNPFRREIPSLWLLTAMLDKVVESCAHKHYGPQGIAPCNLEISCLHWDRLEDPRFSLKSKSLQVKLAKSKATTDVRYAPPDWVQPEGRWRLALGQLMRAAIVGSLDYSRFSITPPIIQGMRTYRGLRSSWFKRRFGLFNARSGLGEASLAVTPWLAELLTWLLAWPGTIVHTPLTELSDQSTPEDVSLLIAERLKRLGRDYGRASALPILNYDIRLPWVAAKRSTLKVAVLQSNLPHKSDFSANDLRLNNPQYRRRHRRHLSAMLKLLQKTLDVRHGYKGEREQIDLVVLRELSVHIDDVFILERFADTTKCIVFAGLVFHPHPHQAGSLINSGLWIIPERTPAGRRITTVEQGKHHMTTDEAKFKIQSYRPAQWVISGKRKNEDAWRISASICYDATDLRLASDLRNRSDIFLVSAMNQDIQTFDTMVAALHYHMYQHVILVNSGEYGGTTVQVPYRELYQKLMLHFHGGDHPLVGVIDVNVHDFRTQLHPISGNQLSSASKPNKKTPPAGLNR